MEYLPGLTQTVLREVLAGVPAFLDGELTEDFSVDRLAMQAILPYYPTTAKIQERVQTLNRWLWFQEQYLRGIEQGDEYMVRNLKPTEEKRLRLIRLFADDLLLKRYCK